MALKYRRHGKKRAAAKKVGRGKSWLPSLSSASKMAAAAAGVLAAGLAAREGYKQHRSYQTPEGQAETARLRAQYAADRSPEAKAERKANNEAVDRAVSRGYNWLMKK